MIPIDSGSQVARFVERDQHHRFEVWPPSRSFN